MVEERKISQLPTRTDITGEEYMHIGFNGRSYKITVNSIIAKFNDGINLEVLQEIQDKLTELAQMGDLVTAEELTTAIAAIPAVDLSSFATSTAVADAIAQAIAAIPAVDLSGYATTQAVAVAIGEAVGSIPSIDLSPYAKTEDVFEAISQAVEAIPSLDLSAYAKTADLPVIPDHSDFALRADIPDVSVFQTAENVTAAITAAAPDLSDLVTKLELRETVDGIDIPSLEGYATLEDIPAPADLSGYVTAEVLDSARVAIGAEVTEAISTDLRNNRFVWVSAGPLTGKEDGTLMNPYRTVMDALAGTAGASNVVINLIPVESGSQTEDVTIDGDRQNILIQGYSTNGAPIVIIDGTFTITGDTTRIRVKDLGLRGQDGNPALVISGSIGLHYFDNVDFSQAGESNGPLVVITDRAQRWVTFTNCGIDGDVDIADMVEGGTVCFNGHNSGDTCIYINTDAHVYVKNGIQVKYIEHNAGTVDIRHMGLFTGLNGVAIKSTAVANRCYVSFCDFESANGYTLLDGDHIVVKNSNALA